MSLRTWPRFALLLAAYGSSALGYEPSTHEILSRAAADRSRIYTDAALLTDLGLSSTATFTETDILGQPVATRDARTIIGRGAILEDYYQDCAVPPGLVRPLNHFFDPQHGGRGLTVVGTAGIASPDWALEDGGDVTTISYLCAAGGRNQIYSYRNAQQYLYNALTGQAASYRQQEISRAFQSLGHIVHHIQDMAQPQHSRDDIHKFPSQAYYESYTENTANTRIPQILAANLSYPIPTFATARQYWGSGRIPSYVGMAEFTSHNYVSYGTSFVVSPGVGILPSPGFPYPNATNANGTQKRVETRSVTIQYGDLSGESGQMGVIVGDVFDGFTDAHDDRQILAATSLLHSPLAAAGLGGKFSTNEIVFEDNYRILLPRAVAFSAGLINHFFAGKLDIRRPASGPGWTISNLSGERMSGTFVLHYEDSAGIRYQVAPAGALASAWTGTLTSGQSTPALSEPPTSAAKLVAAFQGTIGSETAIPRTAGKVVSYTPPPVACGGNLKRSGDIAGLDTTVEMGTTSGAVQLSFEAYSLQDSLVVTAANAVNTQLATTGGLVSGLHQKTFTFNSAALGTTKARVRIVGSERGTVWDVAMSCPGKNLAADDFPPSRSVVFKLGSALGGAVGSCQADFFVDGVRVGVAYVSASGGTTFTRSLTKGPGHGAEFRNFSCTSNNTNVFIGAEYTDPSGSVRLQNMNQVGVRLFDVR